MSEKTELIERIKALPDCPILQCGCVDDGDTRDSFFTRSESLKALVTAHEQIVKAAKEKLDNLEKSINTIENLLHGCVECGHITLEWGESRCESCGIRYSPSLDQSYCPECSSEDYEEMCLKCADGVYQYIHIPHELFEPELTALRAALEEKV